jgi:hypothetical protein
VIRGREGGGWVRESESGESRVSWSGGWRVRRGGSEWGVGSDQFFHKESTRYLVCVDRFFTRNLEP